MRFNEILEGKALSFTLRYGNLSEDVLVIQNPTVDQAMTLIERARHGAGSFYLRGLCLNNKTLYVWNGWKATHDDVRTEYLPKIQEHNSDLTTFQITEDGGDVVKPGDYDLFANRYYQNVIRAAKMPVAEAYLSTLASKLKRETKETFTEVFINPTPSEIRDMKALMNREPVKGLLLKNNDVVMWAGHRFHHQNVIDHLNIEDVGTERLMFTFDQILFYGYDEQDDNKAIADRIHSNRILKRWGVVEIGDDSGEVYYKPEKALTEMKIEQLPVGKMEIKLYCNPTRSQLIALLERTPEMRGLCDTENVYFFDAMTATHVGAENAMIDTGMVLRQVAQTFELLYVTPSTQMVSSSYGKPRALTDGFSMRVGRDWDKLMACRNFARLMPPTQ